MQCHRADKAVPASLDTFGWCTWDAFYFTVSAQGVGLGLGSLVAGGAPPQWLVIDDGWQVARHAVRGSGMGPRASVSCSSMLWQNLA